MGQTIDRYLKLLAFFIYYQTSIKKIIVGLNGEVLGYRDYGSTLTIYDSTIATYCRTYAKNALELILMVKFWVISIIIYIDHPNNNLQINSGLK